MNLKELIKKIFKSETKNYGLALPTDLVSVPMRDCLDDDKIKELDEYKDNYLEILAQKKHFTSHNISSKDFSQEMLMNFELFGRLVINHDNNYNLDTMKDYEKDELWLKQRINPIKIKLYIDKMEAMYNETHLRLVALKEIYSESGKKLSKDKQSAILNEIYNLTSNFIIFKNNIYAALKEVETYKKEFSYGQNTPDITDQEYVLNRHELDLTYYVSILIPDKLYALKNINLDVIDKIAYLERELELYAYNHLKIDDLNQELEAIDKIEKAPKNRQMLLDKINELEIKYLVLNDYGGHELDLKPLYEVKFDILTIDIVNQEESPFKNIPAGRELKYYKDIILDKLTTNITGVDSLLNQILPDGKKYLIQYIVELLKYDNLNLALILQSAFSLSLVLSAVSHEKMNYFFNNYQIDFNDVNLPYHFMKKLPAVGIETKDKIPLGTVCWINNLNIIMEKNGQGFINGDTNRIVEIYNYFSGIESEKTLEYKVPEGITEIRPFYTDWFIRDTILEGSAGKTLITPNSLKSIFLEHFYNYKNDNNLYIKKVVLNEGLEEIIGNLDFDSIKTESITIPSTLLNIHQTNSFFPNDSIMKSASEFIFTNFEASNILNDEKSRKYILRGLCRRAYSNFRIMTNPNIYIHESEHNPRNIILVSSNGSSYIISINEIVRENLLKEIHDTGQYSTEGKIVVIDQGSAIKASINEIESEIVSMMSTETKKR